MHTLFSDTDIHNLLPVDRKLAWSSDLLNDRKLVKSITEIGNLFQKLNNRPTKKSVRITAMSV